MNAHFVRYMIVTSIMQNALTLWEASRVNAMLEPMTYLLTLAVVLGDFVEVLQNILHQ